MNKKVKTITTWLAAAIFLFALAINVKVTLDDPFMLLSDEAIAQTTTTTTSTGTPLSWVDWLMISNGDFSIATASWYSSDKKECVDTKCGISEDTSGSFSLNIGVDDVEVGGSISWGGKQYAVAAEATYCKPGTSVQFCSDCIKCSDLDL